MKNNPSQKPILIAAAWIAMLAVSDLPDILIVTLGETVPGWIFWAKAGFLAAFLLLALAVKLLRPLWQYALVFLALFILLGLTNLIRFTDWFQNNFNTVGVSFFKGYAAIFVLGMLTGAAASHNFLMVGNGPFAPHIVVMGLVIVLLIGILGREKLGLSR